MYNKWAMQARILQKAFLGFFLFCLGFGAVRAKDLPFEKATTLERPFGITAIGDKLWVADGGGRLWENRGSKIIVLDKETKTVEKAVGLGEFSFVHSVNLLNNGNWLVTDTGHDLLLEVDGQGETVWSSQDWPEAARLDYPNDAQELANGRFLVTDRNNDRVLEIDQKGTIYWQYTDLNRPHNADRLADGRTLICDSEGNKIIAVSPFGEVVWQFGQQEGGPLYWPRDVDLLADGNLLVVDSKNHRVLKVNWEGEMLWEYTEGLSFPYEADELSNGNILISDSSHARVIEVDKQGELIWEFGGEPLVFAKKLLNGNFEEQFEAWKEGLLLAEGGGEIGLSESSVQQGRYALKLDNEGEGMVFGHQYLALKPGGNYHLEGFIRAQDLEGEARLEAVFLDKLGGQVGISARTRSALGSGEWELKKIDFKVPKEAVGVNIWCLLDGKGVAWFDKVKIVSKGDWRQGVIGGGLAVFGVIIFNLFWKGFRKK